MHAPGSEERFADWLDGRLSPEEEDRLQRDLSRNPELEEQLRRYRETAATVRATSALEHAPPGFADGVMDAIESGGRGGPWRLWLVGGGVAAAAAAMLAVLGVLPWTAAGPTATSVAQRAGRPAMQPSAELRDGEALESRRANYSFDPVDEVSLDELDLGELAAAPEASGAAILQAPSSAPGAEPKQAPREQEFSEAAPIEAAPSPEAVDEEELRAAWRTPVGAAPTGTESASPAAGDRGRRRAGRERSAEDVELKGELRSAEGVAAEEDPAPRRFADPRVGAPLATEEPAEEEGAGAGSNAARELLSRTLPPLEVETPKKQGKAPPATPSLATPSPESPSPESPSPESPSPESPSPESLSPTMKGAEPAADPTAERAETPVQDAPRATTAAPEPDARREVERGVDPRRQDGARPSESRPDDASPDGADDRFGVGAARNKLADAAPLEVDVGSPVVLVTLPPAARAKMAFAATDIDRDRFDRDAPAQKAQEQDAEAPRGYLAPLGDKVVLAELPVRQLGDALQAADGARPAAPGERVFVLQPDDRVFNVLAGDEPRVEYLAQLARVARREGGRVDLLRTPPGQQLGLKLRALAKVKELKDDGPMAGADSLLMVLRFDDSLSAPGADRDDR
ncbi:MAG: hypothetical protein AAF628_15065 [Planctomycetota bacterium]